MRKERAVKPEGRFEGEATTPAIPQQEAVEGDQVSERVKSAVAAAARLSNCLRLASFEGLLRLDDAVLRMAGALPGALWRIFDDDIGCGGKVDIERDERGQ